MKRGGNKKKHHKLNTDFRDDIIFKVTKVYNTLQKVIKENTGQF